MLKTLVITDVVGSTALTARLGDDRMTQIWIEHDRICRWILRKCGGQEADRTDGFLVLFEDVDSAIEFSERLHEAFGAFSRNEGIDFLLRIGIHRGEVILIETSEEERQHGAKPLEVEGIAKATTARIADVAGAGETVISAEARQQSARTELVPAGHWRLKGVDEPVEIFTTAKVELRDREKAYRVVRNQDFWVPVQEVPNNLPRERNAFVGRRKDLNKCRAYLEGGTSLLTLLGPGGMGKTRLSRRIGWESLGDFPGGVWFCDLSEARSAEGIAAGLGRALDMKLSSQDAVSQAGNALSLMGRCLVILDNFEQIAELAGNTLGRWIEMAPETSFLATSRIRLNIPGEKTYQLQPLRAEEEAVELFVRRARDRQSDFEKTEANEDVLVELVKEVDCLPLAIELAAARVGLLSPEKILQHLQHRFRLLTGGAGEDRHKTLKAAIDWSWDLLEEWEKATLAQVSVFEGGFTLEAAMSVIELDSWPDAPWLLDVMQSLVDKSLLKTAGSDEEPMERLGMYVSIQEYAVSKLQAMEKENPPELTAAFRHATYFSQVETPPVGLVADLDNMLIACQNSLSAAQGARFIGIMSRVWEVLELVGPYHKASELIESFLKIDGLESLDRANAIGIRADLSMRLGAMEESMRSGEEALELFRQIGDRAGEGHRLHRLATCRGMLGGGGIEQAKAEMKEALQIFRETAQRKLEGDAISNLGVLHLMSGKGSLGLEELKAGLAIHRETGNVRSEVVVLNILGNQFGMVGDEDKAWEYSQQATELARKAGEQKAAASAMRMFAEIELRRGHLTAAAEYYREVSDTARRIEDHALLSVSLSQLSKCHRLLGNVEECGRLMREVDRLLQGVEYFWGQIAFLFEDGNFLAVCGDPEAGEAQLREAWKLISGLPEKDLVNEIRALFWLARFKIEFRNSEGLAKLVSQALERLDQLKKIDDSPVTQSQTVKVRLLEARSLALEGKPEDAVKLMRELAEDARRTVEMHSWLEDLLSWYGWESKLANSDAAGEVAEEVKQLVGEIDITLVSEERILHELEAIGKGLEIP